MTITLTICHEDDCGVVRHGENTMCMECGDLGVEVVEVAEAGGD
jgi:uncharacterized OB-fold protein